MLASMLTRTFACTHARTHAITHTHTCTHTCTCTSARTDTCSESVNNPSRFGLADGISRKGPLQGPAPSLCQSVRRLRLRTPDWALPCHNYRLHRLRSHPAATLCTGTGPSGPSGLGCGSCCLPMRTAAWCACARLGQCIRCDPHRRASEWSRRRWRRGQPCHDRTLQRCAVRRRGAGRGSAA